ncbi:MAG TPA: OB-fold domain-containing protein [Candidatus Binatia bacterium]|nr:OB-fold domain-containing protein [Candidatus Binatia bacterium]
MSAPARSPYLPPGMPLPAVTDDTRPFWDACRRHALVVQRCTACGAFRHPPTPVCWRCRRFEHEWTPLPGTGTVFSYAVVHRAFLPPLADHVPFTVAVVALDGAPGVRLVSNVVDVGPDALHVGLAVEVFFEDVTPEVSLPRFRLRRP